MNPELYKKAIEHNQEAAKLNDRLARMGITLGPLAIAVGIWMAYHYNIFHTNVITSGTTDYFRTKTISGLIIVGIAALFLSMKWLYNKRKASSA